MKLFLLVTFVATTCYVDAGKTQRMLAAMMAMNGGMGGLNGGMMGGLNGGMMGGLNGGMMGGLNGGMMGGLNGGLVANGVVPRVIPGGLNPVVVAGGGAGLLGQPQFAQLVPAVPAFAVPAPVPNVYPVPAVNGLPFNGVPQMAPMNPPQQPLMGIGGGNLQQQPPPPADPLRRFRRQIVNQDNTLKTTVDTQIQAPTDTMTTAPCDGDAHREDTQDDTVNSSY